MSVWSIGWDKREGMNRWGESVPEHGTEKCRWDMKYLVWASRQCLDVRGAMQLSANAD